MSLNRLPSLDVNRILLFNVKRILLFDVGRILNWPIPPMLLKAILGWYVAAITMDVNGVWRGRPALAVAAASAFAMIVPDLVRRVRAQRRTRLV